MRILLHSPKDMVAGALAFAAVAAIIANAVFLQAGRHPSPMFRPVVAMPAAELAPASQLPRPRPVVADASAAESRRAEPKPVRKPRRAESRGPAGQSGQGDDQPAACAAFPRLAAARADSGF